MQKDTFIYAFKGFFRALLEGFCINIILPLTYIFIQFKKFIGKEF